VRQRGFTLIEILVAVSLLAVLGVLGYRGVAAASANAAHLSGEASRWQDIALALARVGDDSRQAIAVAGRDADGRELPAWQLGGQPAQLTLTRAVAGGELRRLAYRCQAGGLELLLWPAYDAPASQVSHRLLAGVSGCELSVLDHERRWLTVWPQRDGRALPRALRLRLTLAEGGTVERIFDVAAAE